MSSLTLPALAIANASFVTDQLLVGGDLDTRDDIHAVQQLAELLAVGVTHVVDVRQEWSDEDWVHDLAPDLGYLWHGVDDAGQRIPFSWFDEGVAYCLDAIRSGGVVLTHCHMGVNRGPSMGLAVLLALGWDVVDALDAIRSARPIAYVAYAEQVLHWHHVRTATRAEQRRAERAAVAQWRKDNDLDVANVIRAIRAREAR